MWYQPHQHSDLHHHRHTGNRADMFSRGKQTKMAKSGAKQKGVKKKKEGGGTTEPALQLPALVKDNRQVQVRIKQVL